MENATLAAEQRRVARVDALIAARLATVKQQRTMAMRDLTEIEQSYGDATKVNITEVDDRMETNAAVQQQKMMVARAAENETILGHEEARLQLLQGSPYFGRIDISEAGEHDTLYIGLGTFQHGDDFLVYDWRAPIASIYYNGTLGPVSYEAPTGEQTVTLENKRQFKIEHGQITNMFDTNETVGDEILQSVLGEQSSDYMKNIVATIQQEQNDIIRDTTSDLLVVQGVAGSGKTSAVLQRVAYLLYHSRSHLAADQMVLFSPNQLFANYISEVLPSLGEKNMRQATLAEFFAKRFTGLQVETLFDRFEKDATGLPEPAAAIRRIKEDPAFLAAIDRYVSVPPATPLFVDVTLNGEVFFAASTITKIYQSQPAKRTATDKFLATKNTLIKRLNQRIKMATFEDWVQDRLGLLNQEEVRDIVGDQRFDSGDAEQRFVAEHIVAEAFAPMYDALYNDYFFDAYAEYCRFLATVPAPAIDPAVWATMADSVTAGIERHELRLEDAAPLLYLRDRVTGGGTNDAIQYVFVDEMQDYSAVQLRYLHHAFPKAKLTLLGDSRQDVFTAGYHPSDFIHEIRAIFPGKSVRLITLNKSYRSTAPITDFAKALLPTHDHIQSFNRAGHKPRVITLTPETALTGVTQLVSALAAANATVAILTRDAASAAQLYASLRLDTPTHLLSAGDHTLHTGCLILPVYLAKGLEFDAVVGYDVSATTYAQAADCDILYTLASRALHELVLVAIGAVSPLVAALPAQLYDTARTTVTQ